MATLTPASEKNTITPSSNANSDSKKGQEPSADVARKPSVATGALEPRETAGGGILANKHDGGNVRDSGYAAGSDVKDKHGSIAFTALQKMKQEHDAEQPSPAYVDSGNAHSASDSKTGAAGTTSGGQDQPHSPTSLTASEKDRHTSGAFANGAAVTSPDAIPGDNAVQHQRTETAESQLSEQTKAKITKAESKDAKRLMKVIKAEGASQNANHAACLKELSKLQKVQKQASKDESKALSEHGKATSRAHKFHTRFLAAKATYEQAEAEAKTREEYLEASRTHAQNTTADLATKTRELEELRRAKAVDDREREAKLLELSQMGKKK